MAGARASRPAMSAPAHRSEPRAVASGCALRMRSLSQSPHPLATARGSVLALPAPYLSLRGGAGLLARGLDDDVVDEARPADVRGERDQDRAVFRDAVELLRRL